MNKCELMLSSAWGGKTKGAKLVSKNVCSSIRVGEMRGKRGNKSGGKRENHGN